MAGSKSITFWQIPVIHGLPAISWDSQPTVGSISSSVGPSFLSPDFFRSSKRPFLYQPPHLSSHLNVVTLRHPPYSSTNVWPDRGPRSAVAHPWQSVQPMLLNVRQCHLDSFWTSGISAPIRAILSDRAGLNRNPGWHTRRLAEVWEQPT